MTLNFVLKPLILIGLFSCFTPMVVAQYPAKIIAQVVAKYDYYMKIGYAGTAKRDYQTALLNFRRALRLRPGDRYAQKAVDNVSKYVAVIRAQKRQGIVIFIPPNNGAPNSRVAGGTRGCAISSLADAKKFTALIPDKSPVLTAEAYPDILYYIPQVAPGKNLEFALVDEQEQDLYATKFTPGKAGITKLRLSTFKGMPALQIGKKYRWYLSIICQPEDVSANIIVDGDIQRIEVDPLLKKELSQSSSLDRVALYAVNGIWYDAIAHLYTARQKNPQAALLGRAWIDLLTSIGIDDAIAQAPLAK